MPGVPVSIMWFRRDLRLFDNTAFFHALNSGYKVVPLFIFDRNILDQLENKQDRRVEFIYKSLVKMQAQFLQQSSSMLVRYGNPEEIFGNLAEEFEIQAVYSNEDYEAYALHRDKLVKSLLHQKGAGFIQYKDQVIFSKDELVKDDGRPYIVFTPYSNKWRLKLTEADTRNFPSENFLGNLLKFKSPAWPGMDEMGFNAGALPFPSGKPDDFQISNYSQLRDYPAKPGTTRLGIHLRFGTISIRQLAAKAIHLDQVFLNELIWRDFYQMILSQFPHVGLGKSFRQEYDLIRWRNNEAEFSAWCTGRTGYPMVDAGMRELNATGFMHNRVRMIVASFLVKHLLIDWRWGEAYFAEKLLDYDLAANNGGWQWAAGSGCDAAPYFRIFNPALQAKKFDPEGVYIRHWVPEIDSFDYPEPIVEHAFARKRCLETYSAALKK